MIYFIRSPKVVMLYNLAFESQYVLCSFKGLLRLGKCVFFLLSIVKISIVYLYALASSALLHCVDVWCIR